MRTLPLTLAVSALFVAGLATGCTNDDDRMHHSDRPSMDVPMGRDASNARSPDDHSPPPNPNGDDVGATGVGAGGGTNNTTTTDRPPAR